MKFLLIMTICSSVYQTCSQPIMIDSYPNYYDCATSGYAKSNVLLNELGKNRVEIEMTMISFYCKPKVSV